MARVSYWHFWPSFWSKDEILVAAYHRGLGWGLWMSMVACMTAFYMFRIYYLIFFWKKHEVHDEHHAPKDQPWTMTLPLIILAAISCVAGFVPFHDMVTWDGKALHTAIDWTVAGSSVAVALVGIGLATVIVDFVPFDFPTTFPFGSISVF